MQTHNKFTTRKEVQAEATRMIRELLAENGDSPTRVSKMLPHEPNKGLICRVRDGGYSEIVTLALGLPIVKDVSMPICMDCGQVHEVKITCDHDRALQPKRRRKAADLNPNAWGEVQSKALDWLAKDAGFKNWTEFVIDKAEEAIQAMPPDRFEEITLGIIPVPQNESGSVIVGPTGEISISRPSIKITRPRLHMPIANEVKVVSQ